ncbi:MAG TPA: hypothetical protein VF148_04565 [Acidimicrobiia bacterium]
MRVETDSATIEERVQGRARRIGFLTVVVATLALFVVMVPPDITHPVTGWLPDDSYGRYVEFFYGDETLANMAAHRHHMLAFSMAIWIVLVGMTVQLRKPVRKQAPLWAAAAAVVMMLVFEVTLVGFDPSTLILVAPILAAVALHPRPLPAEGISWTGPGRAVAAVAAGTALAYGFAEARFQVGGGATDIHGVDGHYAFMAAAAVILAVAAILGASNLTGARITAWTAGGIGTLMGAFFIGFPDVSSSPGIGWGIVAVLLGLAYLVRVGIRLQPGRDVTYEADSSGPRERDRSD